MIDEHYFETCLKIDNSTLENAGKGVFALTPIPEGKVLCRYDTTTFDKYKGEYNLFEDDKLYIGNPDAPIEGCGCIINDRHCLPKQITVKSLLDYEYLAFRDRNCFYKADDKGIIHFIASKPINKGEELFHKYGLIYWLKRRNIKPEDLRFLLTQLIPMWNELKLNLGFKVPYKTLVNLFCRKVERNFPWFVKHIALL